MTSSAPVPLAFVMSSFDPGGTERQMIELARRLDRSRWAVHIACFRRSGGWFDRAAEAAQSVAEFPVRTFKSPELIRHIAAFARWCRDRQIAVVHTTDLPSNIFGLPGAAAARVPARIANRREINPGRSPLEIALQRAAYAGAHRIVANSNAAAERLARELVPAAAVTVIPNGLDTAQFAARLPRHALRHVVVVANLRPEKGHDVLIDAAPAILARFPDARFEAIGGGSERTALEAHAAARGVLHAFTFSGHCDDVAARLSGADIFVLPSRSDASPNAVVEAMAAGLPIAASSVGGIVELVEHEKSGLLVPPDRPAALADAICRLMADSTFAQQLGATAQAAARARHSFDQMVAAFDAVYSRELDARWQPDARLKPSRSIASEI